MLGLRRTGSDQNPASSGDQPLALSVSLNARARRL